MKLTNNEIYTYAQNLTSAFMDKEQRLPIKLSFLIQKNKIKLLELAQDIEQARLDIAQTYGTYEEEKEQYIILPDNIKEVEKELNDLFSIEQDVNIYTINADCLSDVLTLTTTQMEAIMFMIEET